MLKDWSERPPLDEVMGTLQRQLLALPEATIMTFAPPTLPGLGNASGFDLRIQAQGGRARRSWSASRVRCWQKPTSIRS